MSRTGVLRSLAGPLRCFLTPLARSSPCDWSVCGRPCSAHSETLASGETHPRSPSSLLPHQGSFLREACGSALALLSHPLIVHGLPGPWSYCYSDAAMYRVLHTVESLRWSALPTSPQRPEPLSVPAGRCATVPPVRRHGYHGLVSYMLLCLCLLLLQTSCSYIQVLRLPVV
ncbi:hypothetical protein M432DRAFT_137687 [Thermoascus aurantiacus ATCC 26904]